MSSFPWGKLTLARPALKIWVVSTIHHFLMENCAHTAYRVVKSGDIIPEGKEI
jgi:hypothetical protein